MVCWGGLRKPTWQGYVEAGNNTTAANHNNRIESLIEISSSYELIK